MKIAKIVDQFGWAYYFLDKEHQKYSEHKIVIQKHNDVKLDDIDAVYIHGPDISPEARDLCLEAKQLGIKVIGGHAGPVINMPVYPYLDLAVGISPQTFDFCKTHYSCPTVFLPEGIDTEFFRPTKRIHPIQPVQPTQQISTWLGGQRNSGKWRVNNGKLSALTLNNKYTNNLIVGWAGRRDDVKRMHLLSRLDYKVEIQSQHGTQFFVERSLDHMLRFYSAIDVLVMTSLSECMPRVVLEACACGIPVVCTDVGSIRMILDPNWIVPVNPEKTVVEEMNKRLHVLEDNKSLRQKVSSENRQRVEKTLSWKILSPYWDAAITAAVKQNTNSINAINHHFGIV